MHCVGFFFSSVNDRKRVLDFVLRPIAKVLTNLNSNNGPLENELEKRAVEAVELEEGGIGLT